MNILLDYVKSDLCRYVGLERVSIKSFFFCYFVQSGFKFSFWLRVARFSRNPLLRFFAKINHHRLRKKYGLDISIKTTIGYGLYIGHGQSIVINSTATIGNNVNLSQFTTIGSNKGDAAIIGDSVYIGPSVCIVENVRIGSNISIGAGCVVTKDINDNCTVVGVPGRVVKDKVLNNSNVENKWPC